ncbi:hypothetical protein DFH06DRAFT_1473737 [Mycena polygramma]|nr:hypothetical protein DFH06DRAFT_1473737 [Mycena polygramma]
MSAFHSTLLPGSHDRKRVRDLLRTSSPPPDPDSESHFRCIIASSTSDLARYDNEIHAMQEVLNRLISERSTLQDYSDECRGVFAPVRRLPPEILAEIFALCRPGRIRLFDALEDWPQDCAQRATQSHLLRLSQVCCSWYDTVTGTPKLWATIEAALIPNPDKTIPLLWQSLERSGSCPLTIHCTADPSAETMACFEVMAQHSSRLQDLDIFVHDDPLPASFIANFKAKFPLLQYLALGGDVPRLRDIFEVAPKLTHVTLAHSGEPLPLPWNQLREVTYEAGSCGEDFPFAMIQRCSRQCAFIIRNHYVAALEVPILTLPPKSSDIHSLDWAIGGSSDSEISRQVLGGILSLLILPYLQELTLQPCANEPLFWPRDGFLSFASRCGLHAKLTKLSLHEMVITEDELLECLSGMQALQKLFIQDVPSRGHILITDHLVRRLTWTSDSTCLIPHLSSFHFASIQTFSQHTLLDFVNSRLVPGRTDIGPFNVAIGWQWEVIVETSIASQLAELIDRRGLCCDLYLCALSQHEFCLSWGTFWQHAVENSE